MKKIIEQYFSLYHTVCLNRIGTFRLATDAARIDIADRLIYPPLATVIFNEGEDEPSDHFDSFLREQKIDVKELVEFQESTLAKLKDGQSVYLHGIGTLDMNENRISFHTETSPPFFAPVYAERVIRKKVSSDHVDSPANKTGSDKPADVFQTQRTENRWWIGALILAAIGIAAIAFYYLKK